MGYSIVRWTLQYGVSSLGEENSEGGRPVTLTAIIPHWIPFSGNDAWRLQNQSPLFWASSVQGLRPTLHGTHEKYPPSMHRPSYMLRPGFIHGLSICHKSPLCDFPLTFLNMPPKARPSPSPFLKFCLLLTTEPVSGTGMTAIDVGIVDEIPVAIPGNGDSFESLAYLSTLCSLLGDVVSPSNGLSR